LKLSDEDKERIDLSMENYLKSEIDIELEVLLCKIDALMDYAKDKIKKQEYSQHIKEKLNNLVDKI